MNNMSMSTITLPRDTVERLRTEAARANAALQAALQELGAAKCERDQARDALAKALAERCCQGCARTAPQAAPAAPESST